MNEIEHLFYLYYYLYYLAMLKHCSQASIHIPAGNKLPMRQQSLTSRPVYLEQCARSREHQRLAEGHTEGTPLAQSGDV